MNNYMKLPLQVFALVNLLNMGGLLAMNENKELVSKYTETNIKEATISDSDYINLKETLINGRKGLGNGIGSEAISHNGQFKVKKYDKFVVEKRYQFVTICDMTDYCLVSLVGHSDRIHSVAISHDDKFIVTGSYDKTAKIWDVKSGKCLATLEGHIGSIYSVAISHDDKFVVTGAGDETPRIWDAKSGKCVATLKGHTSSITTLAISHDDKFIVTGSGDKTAKIWDADPKSNKYGKCLATLEGHYTWLESIAISNDDNLIITSCITAKIWDRSGKCLGTLKGHDDVITSVAVSDDNKFIVSISDDKTAKIWDVKSNKCLATLKGHSDHIRSVAISKDSKFIVTESLSKTAKVWDAESGKCLTTLSETLIKYYTKTSEEIRRAEEREEKMWRNRILEETEMDDYRRQHANTWRNYFKKNIDEASKIKVVFLEKDGRPTYL